MAKRISCFGPGSGQPGEPAYDQMVEVGRLIAQRGGIVVTGGGSGSGMEAPARGAREAGGEAIGHLWRGKTGNPFLTQCVDHTCDRTGAKQSEEDQYTQRLSELLKSDGFIISPVGGKGTLVEVAAVLNLGCKVWSPPKPTAFFSLPDWAVFMDHLAVQDWLDGQTCLSLNWLALVETPEQAVRFVMGE